MKIAAIHNVTPNFQKKRALNANSNVTRTMIERVNRIMMETGGKSPKLSPMDKFADLMLNENVKEIPQDFCKVKEKFDNLSKFEQDIIMLSSKGRKRISELVNDKERLNAAAKEAWNSVMNKHK